MVSVTPAAADQIRQAALDSHAEGLALRVAAHFHDGEMHFGMGFDERREEDQAFEEGGVTLLVSPLSIQAVAEITIDYVEMAPGDYRFIFYKKGEMPAQAAPRGGGCGCGKSGGGCGSGG